MKRGDTLMRVKRFRVDDMKRRMGTLDGMKSDLERKLTDLEEGVARERVQAQDDLNAAFQDLKSLEIATEQQAKRVAEVEARSSQSRIDEMAIVRHLRKHALRQA